MHNCLATLNAFRHHLYTRLDSACGVGWSGFLTLRQKTEALELGLLYNDRGVV